MNKKNVIIFYKQGQSIHSEKNTLTRFLRQSKLLMPESTNITYVTKNVDIHFVDIEFRNVKKFLNRYPDFDFGIDVNTDELYSLYPDRIPNDFYTSSNWSNTIIKYIENNSNKIHVYYTNKEYSTIEEMDVSELEYKNNNHKYFKSKEDLLLSVKNSKEYYKCQMDHYRERCENYKNMLSKVDEFLKRFKN